MLELKHLPVSSFNENIAYIHRDCPVYKIDNIKTMTRIEIHGGAAPVYAFLQIVDSSKIIRPDELGLNTRVQTDRPAGRFPGVADADAAGAEPGFRPPQNCRQHFKPERI